MHLQVCGKSHIRPIIFHEGLFSILISVSKIPYSCHSQASFIRKIEYHFNLHQHVPSSPASLTNTVHTGYSGASLLSVYAVTRATVVSPHPGESSWRQGRAETGDGCQDMLPLHHKQKQCPDRLIHCDHNTSIKYQEFTSSGRLKWNRSKW